MKDEGSSISSAFQQAEEAKAQWMAIVRGSDDAIMSTTLEGIITHWNPGAERLFGYSATEVVGKHISMHVPTDRSDELAKIMEGVKQAKPARCMRTTRRRKDGNLVEVALAVFPVLDAAGRVVSVSTIAQDRSEVVKLNQQLQRAQQLETVGRLAGGLAHDVNNLLTAINGYSEIAMMRLGPHDPVRGLVGEIRKAGERAGALTRQFLAFSKQFLEAAMPPAVRLHGAEDDDGHGGCPAPRRFPGTGRPVSSLTW